jgi:hypothetical protein
MIINRRLYYKQYYQKNRERLLLKDKKYNRTHKRKIKKYHKEYYKKNKIYIDKQKQIYYKTAKGIYSMLKSKAKNRQIKFNISESQFVEWYKKQDKICYYCKRKFRDIKKNSIKFDKRYTRLTIERKDNIKGYSIKNIVLACFRCNFTKNNYFTVKEMLKIGKIINNKELKKC